jgi:hypothetical protein
VTLVGPDPRISLGAYWPPARHSSFVRADLMLGSRPGTTRVYGCRLPRPGLRFSKGKGGFGSRLRIINTSGSTGITPTAADDPITVTASGTIDNSSSNYALLGPASSYLITNYGLPRDTTPSGVAVWPQNGGTVVNSATSAIIAGSADGVKFSGAAGLTQCDRSDHLANKSWARIIFHRRQRDLREYVGDRHERRAHYRHHRCCRAARRGAGTTRPVERSAVFMVSS